MATAAAAAATIGINVELVVTACTALGVGVVGAIFTGKLIEQVRDWIKSRGVSSEISDHVMKKNINLMINVEQIAFWKWHMILNLEVHG